MHLKTPTETPVLPFVQSHMNMQRATSALQSKSGPGAGFDQAAAEAFRTIDLLEPVLTSLHLDTRMNAHDVIAGARQGVHLLNVSLHGTSGTPNEELVAGAIASFTQAQEAARRQLPFWDLPII